MHNHRRGKEHDIQPHSWTNRANIIFLDQPVGVGYSYSSDGSTVNTSPAAGLDVYAFLELFVNRFPKYARLPFHIAAESYGGTYAPNIASVIYKKNKELAAAPNPKLARINLASVILANGITDPYTQMALFLTMLAMVPTRFMTTLRVRSVRRCAQKCPLANASSRHAMIMARA
jgi:cathepsin A (carboxypeptidase C)